MRTGWLAIGFVVVGCGGGSSAPAAIDAANGSADAGGGSGSADAPAGPRGFIVIPLENKDEVEVYGNTTDAPYINSLLASAAHATKFQDELMPVLPSEPHYIWMEAGTNAPADYTFVTDADAGTINSTATALHLSTQLDAAGLTWRSYQEGITAAAPCPIASTGTYAAKHDPFVFFRDVSGSPPSATNARCAAHHGSLADLATDLAAGALPAYSFITPDLCHDMHGDASCPSGTNSAANVKAGDTWLAANLPALIEYTHHHDTTIFLVWDEGDGAGNTMPFVAIGDHVVAGATDATTYTHSSMLATIERALGLPKLATVAGATDLAAMFRPGYLP